MKSTRSSTGGTSGERSQPCYRRAPVQARPLTLFKKAMIDLYRRCGAVEYPSRWVQTAAFRTWMHQKERQRRVRPVDAIEHFDVLCSDDQNAMVELRADLLTVARRLPTAQGQVLALHVKGLSHKEIADRLDKSQPTVRSLLRNARDSLRSTLEAER
jgi:RNA polymerase sigma factor (sigma-70 family)